MLRVSLARALVLASLLLLVWSPLPGFCGVLSLDVLPGGGAVATTDTEEESTFGFHFEVEVPIVLDGLGFWDQEGDGLAESHLIRLWTFDGTLLESAVVDHDSVPTASARADGRWLIESVGLLLLAPGDYVIGADGGFSSDALRRLNQPIATTDEVMFVDNRTRLSGTGTGFPFQSVAHQFNPQYFGPTFTQVAAAPEASPLTLMLMVGLFLWRSSLAATTRRAPGR